MKIELRKESRSDNPWYSVYVDDQFDRYFSNLHNAEQYYNELIARHSNPYTVEIIKSIELTKYNN